MAVAVALGAGLLLGVPIAFMRDRLDGRIRTVTDLEGRLGFPVLAALPRKVSGIGSLSRAKLAAALDPAGPTAEGFRRLRAAFAGILQREQAGETGRDQRRQRRGRQLCRRRNGGHARPRWDRRAVGLRRGAERGTPPGARAAQRIGSDRDADGRTCRWTTWRSGFLASPDSRSSRRGIPVGPVEEWVRLDVLEKLMDSRATPHW